MSFEPDKINQDHIQKAVQKIKDEGIDLNASTGYDVIINGESFPPKEIMRYAHEQMNGEIIWEKSGGEPTNLFLENLGFKIISKGKQMDYFDLEEGLGNYQKKIGQKYAADDPAAEWWKQTRKKLEYLVKLLGEKVGSGLNINYREKPNGQAGRGKIVFKDSVIIGCKPKSIKQDYLFIKLAFHSLSDRPKLDIEIDADRKLEDQIYTQNDVLDLKNRSSFSLPVNQDFPDNWPALVERIEEPLKNAFELYIDHHGKIEGISEVNYKSKDTSEKLNQILFGPPGTGKTYHTVNRALQIVAPEFYEKNKNDRKELTTKFKKLLITNWEKYHGKQIATTTFHQSFTYEDFIEGIKPKIVDRENRDGESTESEDQRKGEVAYEIQSGIFKRICDLARQDSGGPVGRVKRQLRQSEEDFKTGEFFKYSGDFNTNKEELYKKCIRDGRLYFSYLDGVDLTDKEENEIIGLSKSNDFKTDECKFMAIFRHQLSKGDYIIYSTDNTKFRAIGKVMGDYQFHENEDYTHSRRVKWIVKNEELRVDLIYSYDQNFRENSIYQLSDEHIKTEFFTTHEDEINGSGKPKPYVLIIDEINRGNIAQIFGELITLIEKDKRDGMNEEWPVSLPYSKKIFSVPQNLYIIGTMNTADRSIEALDTALRRRFTFEEMPPKPSVIEEHGDTNEIYINGTEFKLTDILETINNRVEKLLDKDHLIGHSNFMKVKTVKDLQRVFHKNIIPLLEEYFYGDKGKIQMVLGKGFIEKSGASKSEVVFAESDYEGASLMDEIEVWKICNEWKGSEEKFSEALQILRNE